MTQDLIPGALPARDLAIKQFKATASAPLDSKPEYTVVWSGKENAGDMSGNDTMRFESMCGGGIFFLPDITNVQPDFNRKDWPGHPDGGFYKPHSMVWVVPEAVAGERLT